MVRDIIHDPIFLSQPAVPAAPEDLSVGQDLLDTLLANRERCVGMAANMIGVNKRIIVLMDGTKPMLMFNPELIKADGFYETQEGCLSLEGVRPTRRARSIKVRYQDASFRSHYFTCQGFTAQIIQHELDHCSGILI